MYYQKFSCVFCNFFCFIMPMRIMVESPNIILRHIGHLRGLFLPLLLDFIFSYLPVYFVVSSSSFFIIRQYLSDTCLICLICT